MSRLLLIAFSLMAIWVRPAAAGDYELIVESAKIKKTKANGKAWDAANGPPDPYLIAAVLAPNGKDRVAVGKTAVKKDTLEPRWQERVPSVSLGDVVALEVWDKDVAVDDLIGKDQLTITKMTIEQGKVRLSFGQVDELRLLLRANKEDAAKPAEAREEKSKATPLREGPPAKEGPRQRPLGEKPRQVKRQRPCLAVQFGHRNTVMSGAFSPDGTQIITGSIDRTARLWDAATGKELRPRLGIALTNRGSGIGRVVVLLNGKELTADARGPKADPSAAKLQLEVNLANDPRLVPGQENVIEFQAYNAEGYLRSRGLRRTFTPPGKSDSAPPELWLVVAGVSDYRGNALDLRYAAKGAGDFAQAARIAGERLFGPDKIHVRLLTTTQEGTEHQPSRANLVAALREAQKAKTGDVVMVYLAGHGVNYGGQDGDFYFLCCDAADANLADSEVRKQVALSSHELTELLKLNPAQKQVLVLDTCASGKLIEKLTEKRDVPSSQVRALELVKDRTGMYILAGCASDAVSYETTRYAQGILTYSLLVGMRGAALKEDRVEVGRLFEFAADKVPELARNIGGIQKPVIASPKGGQPFPIGRLTAEDQARIPLQEVRPLVLRCNLQDEAKVRDHLGLSKRVNERLREASASGRSAKLVFVEAEEFPDAYVLAGRYRLAGETVTVTLRLFRGAEEVARFRVEGSKKDLNALAGKIVRAAAQRLEDK